MQKSDNGADYGQLDPHSCSSLLSLLSLDLKCPPLAQSVHFSLMFYLVQHLYLILYAFNQNGASLIILSANKILAKAENGSQSGKESDNGQVATLGKLSLVMSK